MTESLARKQLKEKLNSELGADVVTEEPSKGSDGSAKSKKKKAKSKRAKDSSDYLHLEPNNPVPESSDLSSTHTDHDAKLSEETVAIKKKVVKKDKGLSSPAQSNENCEKKSGCGKKQNSRDNHKETDSKQNSHKDKQVTSDSKIDKEEPGKSQKELQGKSQKAKEKFQKTSKEDRETKESNQKTGKTVGHVTAKEGAAGDGKNQTRGNNMNNNKPRPGKPGDAQMTEEFLKALADNKMHVLKKPSQKFRNARFFCKLCDFHLDQVEDCMKHMKDNRHCRRKEISEVDAVLRIFPSPSESQISALTTAVDNMWTIRAISPEEQKLRQKVVTRLEILLQQHIPDVLLYMYGSSLTGFGLKSADINVDLCSTDINRKLTFLLKDVHTVLHNKTVDCGFSNVRADFSAKVPVLLITDDASGLVVTMAIHCYSAHCSSELLSIYADMDLRVKKLVVAFRYWAHLCALDRQKDGFIPPQALNIMVIYFLQVLTPQVIPIINPPKVSGEDVGDYRKDEPGFVKMRAKAMKAAKDTSNNMSVGELWLRLLRFYSLEFDTGGTVVSIRSNQAVSRNTKPWNCKKLAVEDPYMLKKNITRMVNNSRIYEYWQDSIRKAYYYFGLPRDKDGKSLISEEDLKSRSLVSDQPEKSPTEINAGQNSSESSKAAEAKHKNCSKLCDKNDLPNDNETVFIAPNPLLTRITQPANIAISRKESEPRLEASRVQEGSAGESHMKSSSTSAEIKAGKLNKTSDRSNSLDLASTSVVAGAASVLLHTGATNPSLSVADSRISESDNIYLSAAQEQSKGSENISKFARSIAEAVIAKAVSAVMLDSEDEGIVQDSGLDSSDQCKSICNRSDVSPSPIIDGFKFLRLTEDSGAGSSVSLKGGELPGEAVDIASIKEKEPRNIASGAGWETSCLYDFDKNYFTDGKGPTLVCTFCEKEGHLKNSCPEDELPEVLDLPEMTDYHLKVLSQTLNQVPSEVGLSDESIRKRWQFLRNLQDFINYIYDDAELTLFGSTCNGFGFDKSDMDICMTFSRRNGKKVDKVHVIETLARRLKNYGELYNVQAISTAKVPIVKFTIRGNELEGDISLYNTLAQQNTKLLYCYSMIDPRVRVLGYAIKTFAKVCDIGDASRGSLSSYAYILMMLYYLQQVEPPVIPVLQELHNGKKPELIVEDCDAWFMEDISQLPVIWPQHGKNKMSVAELWLGFLRFYVEEFNYKEFVVSIRQKALLTRFEKLWNGNSIAVEDPFDVSHNLGSGLTRKMNNFIFKTFINGRMLYGSPIDQNMELFKSYQCAADYFFDTELLSENRPPNVRGCRRCGKIGHMVRACPLNRKDREEEEEQRQRQQQQRQQQQQQRQQNQQQHHTNTSQGAQGRPQTVQVTKTKQHDRGFASPQPTQSHQYHRGRDYRDRDRWSNNNGRGGGGHINNRHNSGGHTSSGNTNRNSSAASGCPTPALGYGPPLLDQPLPVPHHQQQHYNQQQPQQRAINTSQIYHNSSYQQNQQQYSHHQHYPRPHHQQQQVSNQQQQVSNQQQQLRYQQQEQQRQAAMAVHSGNSGRPLHNPHGFSMQPVMTSTPRPVMNLPPQRQHHQQQHQHFTRPPPGFGPLPLSPQQPQAQQMRGNFVPGLLPSPAHQFYSGGSGGGASNQQAMLPIVQSLFSNARHQVQSMSDSNRYPNQH